MKIFVFDTETTGFIDKKETDLDKQPHIIQFSGIMGEDEDGKFIETERINILINPGVNIPFSSSSVNHIYNIDVQDKDTIDKHIDEILHFINDSDVIIGHNVEYDEEMIRIELRRLGIEYKYNPKQVVCTMKSSVDYCAIKGNGERLKFPKLGELHKKLFGEYFAGAHDAIVDVENTLNCFLELEKLGIISIAKEEKTILSLF